MEKSAELREAPSEGISDSPRGNDFMTRTDILRLIECPKCGSQFGLPPSSFADSKETNPQLHCSRCDSVFRLSENQFFETNLEFVDAETLQPLHTEGSEPEVLDDTPKVPSPSIDSEVSAPRNTETIEHEMSSASELEEPEMGTPSSPPQDLEDEDDRALRFHTSRSTGEMDTASLFRSEIQRPSSAPAEEARPDRKDVSAKRGFPPLQETLFSLFQTKTVPQPTEPPLLKESVSEMSEEPEVADTSSLNETVFSEESQILDETRSELLEPEPLPESEPPSGTPLFSEEEPTAAAPVEEIAQLDITDFTTEVLSAEGTEESSPYAPTDREDVQPNIETGEDVELSEHDDPTTEVLRSEMTRPEEFEEETTPDEFADDTDEDVDDREEERESATPLESSSPSKIIDISMVTSHADDSEFEAVQPTEENPPQTGVTIDELEVRESTIAHTRNRSVSSGATVFFLASPVIGFLLLLYGASTFLLQEGSPQHTVKSIASYDMPTPPPEGLLLQKVSFQRLSLLSGEEIFYVRGELTNRAGVDFSQVEIEAALFDKDGVLITQKATPVGRAMNLKSGIPSDEVARTLEKQHSSINNKIAAKEKRNVSVFFRSSDARQAEFFTMRVRSISY